MRLAPILMCVACGRSGFDPSRDASVDAVAPNHLVVDFEFESDGVLHDRAGGHEGQCTTCPVPIIDPIRGSVLSLSGLPDVCFFIADTPDLRLQSFTWSLWVWRVSNTFGTLFSRPQDGATGLADTFALSSNSTDMIWEVNGVPQHLLKLQSDEWDHIAATYDGDRTTFYLNGVMVGGLSVGALTYTNDAFRIGCDFDTGAITAQLTGMLDSVRVYDTVLSQPEVAALAAM